MWTFDFRHWIILKKPMASVPPTMDDECACRHSGLPPIAPLRLFQPMVCDDQPSLCRESGTEVQKPGEDFNNNGFYARTLEENVKWLDYS